MKQILLKDMSKHVEGREVLRDSQYDFTEGKLCLTNLVSFYYAVTVSGQSMDVIYLGFCEAFATVLLNILAAQLERYGFDGWSIRWKRKWLDGAVKNYSQQLKCPSGNQ